MRVTVFGGAGRICIEEVEDPKPEPDGLVVKVCRCGVCGADVSMTSGGPFDYPLGVRMGHESAGEVVEVGRLVTKVKVGDRVALMPSAGCGACQSCQEGRPLLCASAVQQVGGFGEYIAARARAVTVLPQTLSLADGALVEPMACGLHGLRKAGLRGGERILTLGAGSMAMAVAFWGRRLGASRIVCTSRSSYRDQSALVLGADAVCAFDDESILDALGGPPDIVAECVGKPGMLAKAMELVRPGGVVVSLGMCGQAEPVIAAAGAFKDLKLVFPIAYSVDEFVETARAFDAGLVRPDVMVSDVIPLSAVPDAIEALRQGRQSRKIQVDPWL
jgi:(R,R)-butanediol dehydrogenase/meso-butanediol dehydrogenase/diacetyl reductase